MKKLVSITVMLLILVSVSVEAQHAFQARYLKPTQYTESYSFAFGASWYNYTFTLMSENTNMSGFWSETEPIWYNAVYFGLGRKVPLYKDKVNVHVNILLGPSFNVEDEFSYGAELGVRLHYLTLSYIKTCHNEFVGVGIYFQVKDVIDVCDGF